MVSLHGMSRSVSLGQRVNLSFSVLAHKLRWSVFLLGDWRVWDGVGSLSGI